MSTKVNVRWPVCFTCIKTTVSCSQKRFQNFDYMYSVVGTNFPSVNKDDNAFGKLNYLK